MENVTLLEAPISEVLELLPEKISLVYVDQRDSLDEHPALLQDCIHNGNMDALYEESSNWYIESDSESIEIYKKDLSQAEKLYLTNWIN